MNTYILHINNLTKGFSHKIKNSLGEDENEQYMVLNNLDLDVPIGKIVAIIGGNGVGKTTLFNVISGFTKPDSGLIEYYLNENVINVIGLSPDKIANLKIGRMFQDNHIFFGLSVLDNMLISSDAICDESPFSTFFHQKKIAHNEKIRLEKVESVFYNLFGINNQFWEHRNMIAGNLSYGQQRLLGLARLFMRHYEFLMLDEPTSGVDNETIEQILVLIKRFSENGQTVLLIEHNMQVVLDLADICCFMDKGKVVLTDKPKVVIGSKLVSLTYSGL